MKILVYSSMLCPYCFAAKTLLKKLNLKFEEVLIEGNSKMKKRMIELSDGRTSVPQIFFGDRFFSLKLCLCKNYILLNQSSFF